MGVTPPHQPVFPFQQVGQATANPILSKQIAKKLQSEHRILSIFAASGARVDHS
jgi:hypothetical protein